MKKINKIFEILSVVLLAAMLVLVLAEVLFRYVLKLPLTWSQEFARLFYVYVVFLLIPPLELECGQLHVAYFFNKIPYAARKIVYYIVCFIYIVFLAALTYGAILCAKNSYTMIFSSVQWVKMWMAYVPVIIGAFFGILMVIYRMIHCDESLKIYEAENDTREGEK